MAVVIFLFKTPGGNYVYDRETNSLLSVTDTEYEACRRVEAGEANNADWELLKRYTDQGYLQETRLEKIEHGATKFMPYHINSRMSQLTMQVTQGCNLRCSYCAYGGNYEHQRSHSDKTMSLETMKKCVDFAMRHSGGVEEFVLAFYGGEPLLEIENIKSCVEYVGEAYRGRPVRYAITTNGTIFNDNMIQFLDDNNFSILISLDGPKIIHDKHRVFENGQGSFDKIMENLEYIKEHFPSFFNKIMFNTIVAPGSDFACINEYFDVTEVMKHNNVTQNTVSPYDIKDDVMYDDLYDITYGYQHMKVLLAALGLCNKDTISKLFVSNMSGIERFYSLLSNRFIHKIDHPGGPCLPGVMRPFVAVDGSIFPCERVGEGSEATKLGHIDTGFNMDKVDAVLNIGRLTEPECIYCWNFIHCGLCVATCDGGDVLSREVKLPRCASQLDITYNTLRSICLLAENGYDLREKFTFGEGM